MGRRTKTWVRSIIRNRMRNLSVKAINWLILRSNGIKRTSGEGRRGRRGSGERVDKREEVVVSVGREREINLWTQPAGRRQHLHVTTRLIFSRRINIGHFELSQRNCLLFNTLSIYQPRMISVVLRYVNIKNSCSITWKSHSSDNQYT